MVRESRLSAAQCESKLKHPTRRIASIVTVLQKHPVPHLLSLLVLLLVMLPGMATAQGGSGFTIYGDLKVDESKVSGLKPTSFQVVLQTRNLSVVGRQTVAKNGRYRFENLNSGIYYIIVMMESSEIANVRVMLVGSVGTDYRQDISLEWRPSSPGRKEKTGVVSADLYLRSESNSSLFEKAEEAIKKKNYTQAISLLRKLVTADPKDFEAWTELGTMYFTQKEHDEAEKSYLRSLVAKPLFALALLNLGKLRLAQKNNAGAIEMLAKAVTVPPPSAEANYFLGEAYLATGKGSKAVDYMNEAIRIDPIERAEIHLRVAEIYDNVGLKELAAGEYEKFLKKRPDYPEKKKLQKYVADNKP